MALHKTPTDVGSISAELAIRIDGTDMTGSLQHRWEIDATGLPYWLQPTLMGGQVGSIFRSSCQ